MAYKIWNDSSTSVPTVYLHSFCGDGAEVWKAAHDMNCPKFNLVSIHGFDLDSALSPWPADGVRKGQPPFKGNAAKHLDLILQEIVPKVEQQLPSPSLYTALAGYSLAGLFTLWSAFHTDKFLRLACVSASFWYPDFLEYCRANALKASPQCLYFSLGDKESQTKHPRMRQVRDFTEAIYREIKQREIPTCFEINPGNHFTEPDRRMAKAINWMLRQK